MSSLDMRIIKCEIASCIAALEWLYDQIPEMTAHQIQTHLGMSMDQQRQLLALLDSIGEGKTAAQSQIEKQLKDLRAIQRNLLKRLSGMFSDRSTQDLLSGQEWLPRRVPCGRAG